MQIIVDLTFGPRPFIRSSNIIYYYFVVRFESRRAAKLWLVMECLDDKQGIFDPQILQSVATGRRGGKILKMSFAQRSSKPAVICLFSFWGNCAGKHVR